MTTEAPSRSSPSVIAVPILGAVRSWAPVPLLFVALFLVPALSGPFALQLANLGGLMAIAAMALTVLTGTAGLLSLGHAAFLGIGAFAAGILAAEYGWSFLPTVLAAGVVGLLIGAVVALATLRTTGLYLAVGTFALHAVAAILFVDLEVKMTAAVGFLMPVPVLFGWPLQGLADWWYCICAIVILTYVLLRWQVDSHVGREWICARDHPMVAASMGISLLRARASVFMLTSFVTSASGAVGGYYYGIVQAGYYDLHLAIKYITIIALGKLGSLSGAIMGAYVILLLPHILAYLFRSAGIDPTAAAAGSESIALGIILIVVLLQIPRRVWDRLWGAFR